MRNPRRPRTLASAILAAAGLLAAGAEPRQLPRPLRATVPPKPAPAAGDRFAANAGLLSASAGAAEVWIASYAVATETPEHDGVPAPAYAVACLGLNDAGKAVAGGKSAAAIRPLRGAVVRGIVTVAIRGDLASVRSLTCGLLTETGANAVPGANLSFPRE